MEELLAIFCDVDDFCRDYGDYCQHHLLMDKSQIIPICETPSGVCSLLRMKYMGMADINQ